MTDSNAVTPPAADPIRELIGHESAETGYLVPDYPYGFRLRTEIRYWIDTKTGHGQRLVSQTRNPKKPGSPWNKPKAGTYSPILAMYIEPGTGHVVNEGLSPYADEEAIERFRARFPRTCAVERNARVMQYLIARQRGHKRITWTVTSGPDAGPRQTLEEQAAIINRATNIELAKMRQPVHESDTDADGTPQEGGTE